MRIPPFNASLTVVDRSPPLVIVTTEAKLPTKFGEFRIVAFEIDGGRRLDDVAIVRGDVRGWTEVPVRMHSECLTGDVLGSTRCDCGDQLHEAMRRIAGAERGILLYLRQEGRGIGIANKIRAYALQDEGLDTVDANRHLGFDDDLRRYDLAAGMIEALGVGSIELHTNNPKKVEGLREMGIEVVRRVPLQVGVREENRRYLDTKRRRSGHLLDLDGDE
ncbi:GTP cyclohydrolase II [Paraliomyxa miuraensis]|uniref:GTP cyclohydrolase II n=1 Tax=Paraliomyxa miuraensis TaxID=376150 RepID=UPI0022516C1D|nr:GTP cyclohydrolase II [Paraliomyxa miuraensis]MCX4247590.1 GTP cyclohydrolase II [Paraliomyxa miuraensis]